MKKVNEVNKEEELKRLRDRYYIFYNYNLSKLKTVGLLDYLKERLDKAYEEKNLKQLKAINKEVDVYLREAFSKEEANEIKSMFQTELGETTNDTDRIKQIEKILKKNKISSATEYELIHGRVEEIYSDEKNREEIEKLNALLAAYDSKKK